MKALGSEDFKTYFLGLLAAALAKDGQTGAALDVIAEALVAVERTRERFYAAELHRQKGELFLAAGGERAAAACCFDTAAQIARGQRALALERRALQSLATLSDAQHEHGLTSDATATPARRSTLPQRGRRLRGGDGDRA